MTSFPRLRHAFILLFLLSTLPLAAATHTVTNTNDSGTGSLRQALLDAEAGGRIEFAIGSGPQTIMPLTALPELRQSVDQEPAALVIDARTQPGYSGTPIIEIDGSLTATRATGLNVTNTEVYGLVVNNFVTGIEAESSTVRNCYIGTDLTGTFAKPNERGILVDSYWSTAIVGGSAPGDGNLISGNLVGVTTGGPSVKASIQGNVFGTNAAQTSSLSGTRTHLHAVGRLDIGDDAPNVFAGSGIGIETSNSSSGNTRIHGNFFGVTPAGVAMPMDQGIRMSGNGISVSGNVIANCDVAIHVSGVSLENAITANSIYDNGFGIDLSPGATEGIPTPNDAGDADKGPHNYLNFPILNPPAVSSGQMTVTGTLSTVPTVRTYRIELFASPSCNASGFGEGKDLIDAFDVTTDAAGAASFSRTLPAYPIGTAITATSTSPVEGTSEFSPCATVDGPGQFAFSVAAQTIAEGASAQVTVKRLQGALGAASVTYGVTGGTASSSDSSGAAGTLHFAGGETTKSFTVMATNDIAHEGNETLGISLSNATNGATIGSPSTHTITITDDDPPPTVGPAEQRIAVGEKGTFTVDLGQSVAQNETIALTSSAPSAVSVPATLVIPAGRSFADFEATALEAGQVAEITLTFPPSLGGGTKTVRVRTYTRATLRFSPAYVRIVERNTATVAVSLDLPSSQPTTIGLRSSSRVSVPSSVTIPPGGSASFVVTAKRAGAFTIDAQLPEEYGNEVQLLPGEVIEAPTTPAILSITPSHGPVSGGTDVTIAGANLRSDCSVAFGGVPATSLDFVNTSSMIAVTPPHAGGSVDVVLTCGSDTFTLPSGFGYVSEAPRASSVSPSSGTTAGGTHVRVSGTHFDGSCWLFFDRFAATKVVVRDDESLTGVAPPHTVGASGVTVRCSAGSSTLPLAFTYRNENDPAPLITEVIPSAAAPGELVTVRGLNFRPTDSAAVDTTPATIVDLSPESHVIRVPELPAGRASISVTDLFGALTTSGPVFSVLEARPPRITAVSPARAHAGGELELTGEGFRPGYTFEIGGHAATIVSSEYTRAIVRVAFEVAPGSHAVNVRNRAGALAAIGPNVEIGDDGMLLTSADPRCTTTDGGIYATIRGRGFAAGATASFDGVPSPDVTVIDATTLRVQVPPGAAGLARITVTDAGGRTATLTNGFSYASPFDPRGCGGRSRTVRH